MQKPEAPFSCDTEIRYLEGPLLGEFWPPACLRVRRSVTRGQAPVKDASVDVIYVPYLCHRVFFVFEFPRIVSVLFRHSSIY